MHEAAPNLTPKCRWFRFGLRTLLAVVTLFCIWLGWNVQAVVERTKLQWRDGVSCIVLDRTRHFIPGETPGGKSLPISWRLLGATRVDIIDLDSSTFDNDELLRYRTMFPEAIVKRRTGNDVYASPYASPP